MRLLRSALRVISLGPLFLAPPVLAGYFSKHFEANLSGFYSREGENLAGTGPSHWLPTDRSPRNYIGLDVLYVRPINFEGAQWQLTAANFNPHIEADFHPRDFAPSGFTIRLIARARNRKPVFNPTRRGDLLGYDFALSQTDSDIVEPQNMIRVKAVFHDMWLRWQHRDDDRLTVRLGHFDIPYGINPVYSNRRGEFIAPTETLDIFMKKDWGLGIKGPLSRFEYEFAATLGLGLGIGSPYWLSDDYPASYGLSARVGTPTYWKFAYGLSAFYGRTPMRLADHLLHPFAQKRWRLHADVAFRPRDEIQVIAGLGGGFNSRHPQVDLVRQNTGGLDPAIAGQLTAIYIPPWLKNWTLKAHLKGLSYDVRYATSLYIAWIAEASYSITNALTARLDFEHVLESPKIIGPTDQRVYVSLNLYQ